MNSSAWKAVGCGVALAIVAGSAFAAPKPEDEIRYRQSVFNVIGRNFGGVLGAIAKGERPYDQAEAVKAAKLVADLSTLPFASFGPGTDAGASHKSSPKIWEDPAKFQSLADKFQLEAAKLPAAAADLATLKAQVAETGKTCKGCHDEYRLK